MKVYSKAGNEATKIGESHNSTNRSIACISRRFYELMGEKVTVDQVVGSSPTRATIIRGEGGNVSGTI